MAQVALRRLVADDAFMVLGSLRREPNIRVLDLFSGIGGFSLGLERAGMRTVAFCEIEPFCQSVLRTHWPNVPIFPDIRSLRTNSGNWDHWGIDLICGGFPCQDISLAGKGAGIEGERSGLWSEYARIIGEVRPRYIIVENVAALLGRGLGRVLGDLAALRYDAEWHCIPASAIGAPHRRDRLWLVAYPRRANPTGGNKDRGWLWGAQITRSLTGTAPLLGDEIAGGEPDGIDPRLVAYASREQVGPAGQSRRKANGTSADANNPGCESGPLEPSLRKTEHAIDRCSIFQAWPDWNGGFDGFGRMDDGIPKGLCRSSLSAYGNAIVPQIAEIIGRAIMLHEQERQ